MASCGLGSERGEGEVSREDDVVEHPVTNVPQWLKNVGLFHGAFYGIVDLFS